ncbi:hypothetical protein ABVK25_012498 [Lepraria finkii]|uniref:Choline/carnitine acyltransferase domain-containing protein n=1 Tax=Lepraria finkii TaxID=1340010 RepID=A0ABR4AE76_9LECA
MDEPSAELNLPSYPLPELNDTLELYLQSVRVFCSDEELRQTSYAVGEFGKPGGLGEQLQERLRKRAQNPQVDNWLYDLYNSHLYLNCRAPINPFQHFFGSHIEGSVRHSQATRAAIIAITAFRFKQRLAAETLVPDLLNEQPLCMSSLHWLFNTVRVPKIGTDEIRKLPSLDYIVVLRQGCYFKVALQKEQEHVSFADLESLFHQILRSTYETGPAVAALTADDRDNWAQVREIVKGISQQNHELVDMIDGAAFMICLDEGCPSSSTERTNQFLLNEPSTRWSDKCLQFVICSNGSSASVCEHGLLDGGTLQQLNESLKDAITEYKPVSHRIGRVDNVDSVAAIALPERHTFLVNIDVQSHIKRVEEQFRAKNYMTEFGHFQYTKFGGTFFRTHQCAPKTGFQLVIQLASLLYFGYQQPSWETVSMRTFQKGRVDIFQTVLPSVADFCTAIRDADRSASKPTLRRQFHEASKNLTTTLMRVSRGGGFAAHLYALQEVIRKDEDTPLLFTDLTYSKTRPAKLMTDCVQWQDVLQEGGFFMQDLEHVWVHYEVRDDR